MRKKHPVRIEGVYIADRRDSFVTRPVESAELQYGGIPGDLHFGLTKQAGSREPMYLWGTEIFNRRQISVVSMEECARIAENLGVKQILPSWLGANLAISGYPKLTLLPPGSRIIFPDGSGLLCEGENLPCIQPGEIIQKQFPDQPRLPSRFVKAAFGLRGIVCVVERPGKMKKGDQADLVLED
ncbi:hypothetical protein SAMN04488112_12219 [Melghirimyces thermohalophilus]|uniref:MOSC domain-containing protein n=1 Tax=Melghirimyces thermohalophilus TaxID=1236220 RepID=A0A1G6QK36_9BACL|nr:MOSC domain-containing protein [Melghirimyces thermohalophilus]SDC92571.1 hypothetical protein SAMN04488112_12219 [Melghirimyces thermohalophilus]